MKDWTACLAMVTIYFFLGLTIDSCYGAEIKSMPRPYPKLAQKPTPDGPQLKERRVDVLRQIVINHIKEHVGSEGEKSPAMAVGVVTELDDVAVGLGTRELDKHLPPDGDTLFGLGSITKLFTGVILAQAVAKGDVSLSAKANEWLNGSLRIDDRITLKHLVTHRSGLPNLPENVARRDDMEDHETLELMPAKGYSYEDLASCLQQSHCQPETIPGEHYAYSNLGAGLLSIALQKRYGLDDFNSLNRAKITQPLNMENTSTMIPAFLEKHQDDIAQGYVPAGPRSLKPVDFSGMGILAGVGELISCVHDMNKFLRMITGLSAGALEKAAQEAQRQLGETDQPGLGTAYGHNTRQTRDGRTVHFKAGVTAGYSALIMWQDDPKVGIIILANRGRFRQLMPISKHMLETISQVLNRRSPGKIMG